MFGWEIPAQPHRSPEFPERQWLESTKQYVRKYQTWKMYSSSS